MVDREKIAEQVATVKSAPIPFFITVAAVCGLAWLAINWAYSSVLAGKNTQIEMQDRQIADYKEKLNGASPDQAKKQIEDLQAKVTALAKHIDPRSLTAEQERIFIQAATVSAKAGVRVSSDVACTDCAIYGGEIIRILSSAGWDPTNGITVGPPIHPETGMALSLSNPQSPTPDESKLVGALRAANVPFDLIGNTGGTAPMFLITAPAPR